MVATAEAALCLPKLSAVRRWLWRAPLYRIARESPPLKSKARHPRGELRLQEALGLRFSTHGACRYWQGRILCHQRAQSILRSLLDHPVSCIQNPLSVSTMKLLLIDGHYYVYRSFFAIPNLSNSKGEPTNAVFWDEGMPERRVKLQPAYKETRKEMPKPMVPQLQFIQETLTALLGFRNIFLPNTEADDLMGCYAIAACKRPEMEVVLATNDKDLYQLVGPCVKVYSTAKADLPSPKD